jgi:hypothetical protein
MLIRMEPLYFRPLACRIGKKGMTSKAQFAASVDQELLRVRGMIAGGTVTIFAFQERMEPRPNFFKGFAVAILAVVPALIFYFKFLPIRFIAFPVPAIHIPLLLRPEILRSEDSLSDQENSP